MQPAEAAEKQRADIAFGIEVIDQRLDVVERRIGMIKDSCDPVVLSALRADIAAIRSAVEGMAGAHASLPSRIRGVEPGEVLEQRGD
jgi:hypothetical protein